jgi:hypothetical protein
VQSAAVGTAITVEGGGGNDAFGVSVAPTSGYSTIQLLGGPGSNSLTVTASGGATVQHQVATPLSGVVRVAYVQGVPSVIPYFDIGQVQTSPPAQAVP